MCEDFTNDYGDHYTLETCDRCEGLYDINTKQNSQLAYQEIMLLEGELSSACQKCAHEFLLDYVEKIQKVAVICQHYGTIGS